jgi:hypothetical protein
MYSLAQPLKLRVSFLISARKAYVLSLIPSLQLVSGVRTPAKSHPLIVMIFVFSSKLADQVEV